MEVPIIEVSKVFPLELLTGSTVLSLIMTRKHGMLKIKHEFRMVHGYVKSMKQEKRKKGKEFKQ